MEFWTGVAVGFIAFPIVTAAYFMVLKAIGFPHSDLTRIPAP